MASKWWIGWPGKNHICCDGKVIAGPDWKTFIMSNVLVVVPVAIFLAFSAPFLWYISPVLPLIVVVLCVIAIGSLWAAAFMDPGIIPRVPKVGWLPDKHGDPVHDSCGVYCGCSVLIRLKMKSEFGWSTMIRLLLLSRHHDPLWCRKSTSKER
jgi:hypothetical protein